MDASGAGIAVRGALALATALAAGCAALGRGEQPSDVVVARMHWYRDAPGFRMLDLDWKQVSGPEAPRRLANLCGRDGFGARACAYRVPQEGLCLVYSTLSQEQARHARDASGESIETHELRHCGVNQPIHGGWTHREATVMR